MSKFHASTSAVALLSLTSLAFTSISASAAPEYTVTDLGTLGGDSSYATAINNSGVVVGYSGLADGLTQHAFIYDTVMSDVSPRDVRQDNLFGINNQGQMVGDHSTRLGQLMTVYSTVSGVATNLDMVGTGTSYARGINDAGEITGSYQLGVDSNNTPVQRAFFYRNHRLTDLGFNGNNYSIGNDINNHGDIVGQTRLNNGTFRSFLYSDGHLTDLGTFGGSSGFASAINDEGQITGSFINPSNPDQSIAFSYVTGVVTRLGVPSNADSNGNDINNSGQIVGDYQTSTGHRMAFIAKDGVAVDLNTLIGSQAHLLLSSAWKINDFGQIIGYGYPVGTTDIHAFRLSPTQPQIGIKGLTATANSAGYLHLTWNGVSGAVNYTVYRSDTATGPQTVVGTVTTLSYDDHDAQVGQTYYYNVVATNATGAKLKGIQIAGVNTAPPSVILNLTATTVSTSQINLTWSAASGATSYTIYRSTVSETGRVIVGRTTGLSFSDKNLPAATEFLYVVVAGNGSSGYTKSQEVSAFTFGVPFAPYNVTATAVSKSQIKVSWAAAYGASNYVIYRSTVAGTGRVIIGSTTGTSFSSANLQPSTKYYFVVVAGNELGWTKSPEVSAVTLAP